MDDKNIFQKELDSRGISISEAARRTGLAYLSVQRHAKGERNISAESATSYEKGLGIPREILRPDLFVWDKQNSPHPSTPCTQADEI